MKGESSSVRSGARMSGEDRRLQILRVAVDLFSRKGFRGTTTKEIAEQASVSEAIIFRHFATKRDLYSAIIDYKAAESAELILKTLKNAARRKDDRAVFQGLATDILKIHDQDPTLFRLLLYSGLECHELSAMLFERYAKKVRAFLERYIRQRMADGTFRRIDPKIATHAFFSMISYHALAANLFRSLLPHGNCADVADAFASIFLKGISRL
ncbi:MAG: TetR/AcrR family transcriptional regulator [Acidobacteria bacterium]|nr:TetR/AcrR family transcriptional regulator [Acidobacteriota bacterium]